MKRLALRVVALPPRTQDLALALALTVVNEAALIPYRAQLHPFAGALALVAAETLPLAFRRSHPVVTFLVVGWTRLAYDRLGLGYAPLPLGPAIAYFSVIERCPATTRRIITALLAVGVIASQLLPGHNQPYDFTVTGLIFLTAGMTGVLSRMRTANIEQARARAARAEAERDAGTALAAAAERARIARELHDVVAHHVSLMAVQAEAATSLLPGRPTEAARSVEIIAATARQALTELRRLLGVLRGPGDGPQTSPVAALADIGTIIDQVREAGLPVEYTVAGAVGPLSPGTDLTAYRIIQEALTNTLRHAQAARAEVRVHYEPGSVTVRVTDSPAPAEALGAAVGHGSAHAPAGAAAAGSLVSPLASGSVAAAVPAGLVGRVPAPVRAPARGAPGGSIRAAAAGADRALPRSGLGLAGIAERVVSCGGTLTVGPTSAGGFAVEARLPAP